MTPVSFEKFLANLSADEQQAGERYDELRRSLIRYFRFKGDAAPEEAADTVFDRVLQKLAENQKIHEISNYCFGVARLVALERARSSEREKRAAQKFYQTHNCDGDFAGENEDLINFRHCLKKLAPHEQKMLAEYFADGTTDEKAARRNEIAHSENTTLSNLRTRVHRLRQALAECLQKRRTGK
jgi:DNA-directed RNA polymerase specialized sigma24 family protein